MGPRGTLRHDKPTEPKKSKPMELVRVMSTSGDCLVTRIMYRSTEKSRQKAANRRKSRQRAKAMAKEIGLIDKDHVGAILNISPRHIERLLLLGRFPRPLRFHRSVRWREAEILEWNAAGRPLDNMNRFFKNKAGEME